jgi:hypothetical protein
MLAVLNSTLRPTERLVAMPIASAINDERAEAGCWVSVDTIAAQSGLDRRTVQRGLRELRDARILLVEERLGKSSVYRLDPRQIATRDGTPPVAGGRPSHGSVPPLPVAERRPGGGTAPPESKKKEKENEKGTENAATEFLVAPSPPVPGRKGRKPRPATSLQKYLDELKAAGEPFVPEDDAIRAFVEKAGIPERAFLAHVAEFKAQYTEDSSKRYSDWRAVLRKSVRGGWYRVWTKDRDSGQMIVTAQGQILIDGHAPAKVTFRRFVRESCAADGGAAVRAALAKARLDPSEHLIALVALDSIEDRQTGMPWTRYAEDWRTTLERAHDPSWRIVNEVQDGGGQRLDRYGRAARDEIANKGWFDVDAWIASVTESSSAEARPLAARRVEPKLQVAL